MAETPTYGWWLPPDISTHGYEIDRLINIVHVFMVVLFVGWGIAMLYMLWRFRERPGHRATYQSPGFGFTKPLEIAIFGFELFLLFALATPVVKAAKTPPPESEAVVIRVVAQQFAWNIHYPGPDGIFGRTDPKLVTDANALGLDRNDPAAADDIVPSPNDLHVPVGKKVLIKLSSKDVIHSFWIPVLRVKHDAVPGLVVPMWFEATKTGAFEISCAQLCGNSHYRMRGDVTVETPEQFEAWLKEEAE